MAPRVTSRPSPQFRALPGLVLVMTLCLAPYIGLAWAGERVSPQSRWEHQVWFAGVIAVPERGDYAPAGLDAELQAAGPRWDGAGFLEPPDRAEWSWLLWPAIGLALSTLIAVLVVVALSRFNHKLKREMADKDIARAALNDANALFLNVLEDVDAAIYVIDAASLNVLFANSNARAQFGDMLGHPCYRTLLDRPAACAGCVHEAQTPLRGAGRVSPPCAVRDFEFSHAVSGCWFQASHREALWMDGRAVLVGAAVDITSRKRREDEQEWLAGHDPLTALPNRSLLADRLKTTLALARRSQSMLAVLFLDLDGFKPINDRYGHEVGDELLTRLSRRLERRLRASDTLARLGGDEFVILIPIARSEELREILPRLAEDIREPMVLRQGVIRVDGSIGIALYPSDGDSAEALLRQADEFMYVVKQAGGSGYALRETADAALKVTHWQD